MEKIISIITPCYNESENILELYSRITNVMINLKYNYEIIFIDNASTDKSVDIIKDIILCDSRVKLIINARNFGHIRSPVYGILQSSGDASILIASDLQDPPEMIPQFIQKWEDGYKIALAVKPESEESSLMFLFRKIYYDLISKISEVSLVKNATGAGLFDRDVVDIMRSLSIPNPYFRGLLCEIGFPIAQIPFKQPRRTRGLTKNNFYTLYDIGMLGIINHSKVPIRLMALSGFIIGLVSFLISIGFLIAKLIFWDTFQFGTAPIVIGIFFIGSVQLFSLGLIGEYIATIHTQVRNMPLVVERERINFH